ncbi:FtsP/CotA-like multicopper oxidase with cupredoxin domain [Deinobacterium chartae]|uniref:FtsP/CotA-like multicopper oxidase with cupredoxin domain n=1 Tax=Deinobacterium chartae TaxID=521158 RepID=A0A841I252_9DEIO|nr:multicopper oxidase domain-containing protein [Deinobacterium chartae]MBB6099901.1 FtsP/CotA-like multicopper oxidase with cupredoxin domain [Deinobacterium chartae]
MRLIPLLTLTACALSLMSPAHALEARSLIDRFLQAPNGTVPLSQHTGQVREFTLEVREIRSEIAPGITVSQWAFALPGQAPSVPGPLLRVTEGDLVRITLKNTHNEPHTLHLHGITTLAQEMDGVPHTSHMVLPGESFTYAFVAGKPGTHAYHCHVQTNVHLNMGMYGMLVIEPKDPRERYWQAEHPVILDEWDSRQDPQAQPFLPQPNYFLVNGRAYPNIPDIAVPSGQAALLRVLNMGDLPHSLHLHGHSFLQVAKDGHPLPLPIQADTLLIGPGERYDLLVKGRDGDFPFHDHAANYASNAGSYPGGMHFMLTGSPALDANGKPAPVRGHAHAHHAPAATPVSPASGEPALPNAATAAGHDHSHPTPAAPPSASAASATSASALPAVADVPLTESSDGVVRVRVARFSFLPQVLRIRRGTTVEWVNEDFVRHGIQVEGGASGTLNARGRWRTTFDRPGDYRYVCPPHTFMTGLIRVE